MSTKILDAAEVGMICRAISTERSTLIPEAKGTQLQATYDALVAERDRLAAWINDAWFEGQPVPDDVFDIVERLKETT